MRCALLMLLGAAVRPAGAATSSLSTIPMGGGAGNATTNRIYVIRALESAPLPTVSVGSASVLEGNTGVGTVDSGTNFLRFPLTLSAASSSDVTVTYSTSNGTAIGGTAAGSPAGADYLSATGATATIPAGQTSGTISIPILGETRFESDETLTVTLSGASGATLGTASATGTITNDDAKPTLSINSVSQNEGNSGTSLLTFTVSLSTPNDSDTTIPWSTLDGSGNTGATAGSDYVGVMSGDNVGGTKGGGGTNSSVTIAAGQSSTTLSVTINGDTTTESDETFSVVLGTPLGNATLSARSTGTGTLLNDDGTPTGAATDVTTRSGNPNGVTVLKSGLQRSRGTGRLVQTVILQNNTGAALSGPVYVALDSLMGGTLYNASGTTALTTPTGSPYLTVVTAGNVLPVGSTTIYLEFVTSASTVSYNVRVLASPGAP